MQMQNTIACQVTIQERLARELSRTYHLTLWAIDIKRMLILVNRFFFLQYNKSYNFSTRMATLCDSPSFQVCTKL
ncbi:hypothetical protein HanRHA438_Chr01g0037011 [Helianthus annuus]|nr:hypothetical protein HanIR_Chr01g0039931 [Helianthus annuus]KAJ0949284.1 hypothetical protein HanRHA438_Chr01g0037011 [Helianthus annuus]